MIAVAILAGGLLGGLLRALLDIVIPSPVVFPVATLVVNLVGSVALGFFHHLSQHKAIAPWLRLGMTAGAIGAFTTFSTVCVDLAAALHHHLVWASVYGITSLLGGVLCIIAGEWCASAILRKTSTTEEVCS